MHLLWYHEKGAVMKDGMEKNLWKDKKVCIIDDDENIREIYSVKFMAEEFLVVSAKNGQEGIDLIRKERPDIVLLDIQMPIKDGFDVLQELSTDQILKKIPVIILSNIDDEQAFKKIGDFSTHFYLIKSLVTPQKVVDAVRETLRDTA